MTTEVTTPESAPDAKQMTKGVAQKKAQKRLVAFLKDKGGTGASFLARMLGEMHRKANTGALLVDADGTVGALYQHLGLRDATEQEQAARGVVTFAFHGATKERDSLIDAVLASDPELVIMDMPATSLTMTRKMTDELYGWHSFVRDRGYRLTVVAPITPYKASLYDLQDAIALIGPEADYVAVVNLGLAEDRTDFGLWDGSTAKKQLGEVGGKEIVFPRLKPGVAALLDKHDLTFQAGMTHPELLTSDKMRLQKWLNEAEAALSSIAPVLGLSR